MNNKLGANLTAIILLAIFISGCTEETTTEPSEENLLINTSFEKNGMFSADGWTLPSNSDSSSDVPANGGKYSLLLYSNAPPEVFAEIKVPAMTQFSDFRLSLWSKSIGVTNNVYGKAILSLIRNGSVIKSQSVTLDDISWRNYSIEDTFSVAENDSFKVQLSGGVNQILGGSTYFDLCKLEAIE